MNMAGVKTYKDFNSGWRIQVENWDNIIYFTQPSEGWEKSKSLHILNQHIFNLTPVLVEVSYSSLLWVQQELKYCIKASVGEAKLLQTNWEDLCLNSLNVCFDKCLIWKYWTYIFIIILTYILLNIFNIKYN